MKMATRSLFCRAQKSLGLFVFVLGLFVFGASHALAAATVAPLVSYQARLMDPSGFPVADGAYSIKFSLYDAASAGNTLWTAAGTLAVPTAISVTVQNGLFSVLLGDTGQNTLDSVDWNQDSLYIGVTIGADAEMTPRRRLAAVPQAFNARQLQGMYASSTAFGANSLFIVNQTSNTAATGTRTALEVRSAGTSDTNDFLIRGVNDLSNTVFSVNRQGNVTTTGNLVVVGTASTTNLFVAGQLVCLASGTNCAAGGSTDTLATVTARGSSATTTLQLYGGFVGSSSTVTSTFTVLGDSSLQNLSATNATFTNATTTAFSFSSASGSTLNASAVFVNGSAACLANGTNCPASSAAQTLAQVTALGSFATSTLQFYGGFVGSSSTVTSTFTVLGGTSLQNATATNVTTTNLYVSGVVSTTQLFVNGSAACLATGTNCPAYLLTESDTLASVTARGSSATTTLQLYGGFVGSSSTVTSTLSVGDSLIVYGTNTSTFAGDVSSTRFMASSGSAAAPSFSFASQPSTGMYNAGTSIFFSSFGTAILSITSAQMNTGISIIPTADNSKDLGSNTLRFNDGFFGGVVSSTNLSFVSATGTNVTTTNLYISGTASTSQLYVSGQLVCLASGTNCQVSGTGTSTNWWVYNNASDFLRITTSTTDLVLGSSVTSTGAPAYFDLAGGTTGTSNFYFGYATNANVVIGATSTTQTGLNSQFVMNGNDLFVAGNIGSASSVFTNGEFVAGTGSTYFGNGYIHTNEAAFDISASTSTGAITLTVSSTALAQFSYGAINLQAFADPVLAVTGNITLTGGSAPADSGTDGGHIILVGGDANGTGAPGDLRIFAGNNLENGSGGGFSFTGGSASGTGNTAGGVVFNAAGGVSGANGGGFTIFAGNADGAGTAGSLQFTAGSSTGGANGTINFGSSSPSETVRIRFQDIGSNAVSFRAPTSVTSNYTLTWPTNIGASGTTMISDAAGLLHFQSVCLADGTNCAAAASSETLATVSDRGSFATTTLQLYGGFLTASSTVTGTLSVVGSLAVNNPQGATEISGLDLAGSELTTGQTVGDYFYGLDGGSVSLRIIDVSNPLAPLLTGSVSTGDNNDQDMVVAGRYAYVAGGTAGDGVIHVIDVGNPTAPVIVGTALTGSVNSVADVDIAGRYVYGVGDELKVVDVGDPTNPVLIATSTLAGTGAAIKIQGNYAYVVESGDKLEIFNVTDPSSPVFVSVFALSGTGPNGVWVVGRYVYVFTTSGLQIIDVKDPAVPVSASSLSINSTNGGMTSGNYAYVARGTPGPTIFSIVDVTSSTNPFVIKDISISAIRVKDVFVAGHYAYLSLQPGTNDFAIIDLQGADFSTASIGDLYVGKATVGQNLSVVNNISLGGGLNIGTGGIFSAGTLSISATNTASTFMGDVLIGNTIATSTPFRFDVTATSSRLIIGQTSAAQTRADVTIGAATSSGMNALFSLSGDDLFVAGNIGSASSVYTNGDFVAGAASTRYGDGYLRTSGNYLINGGNATVVDTAGGSVTTTAGSGNGLGAGGNVTIASGDTSGDGDAGDIFILGGDKIATGAGGDINLQPGDSGTVNKGAVSIRPFTFTDQTPDLRFYESRGSGSNYVGFSAGNTLAGDVVWTLPLADGAENTAITTNGAGVLSFTSVCLTDGTNCPATALGNTLAIVTDRGSYATTTLQLYGGFIGASSTVTSTLSVGDSLIVYGTNTSTFAGTVSANKIVVGNGLVGTPSITFASQQNVGFYWPGSGHLTAGVGGVAVMDLVANQASFAVPIVPTTDNVRDLGTLAARWNDGFFGGVVSSTQFSAGDGSVSAPSYTFGNDTNTGIYKTANDTIRFTAGGVDIAAMNLTGFAARGILPYSAGTADVGSLTQWFRNGFFSGTVSSTDGLFLGTVTTTNLAVLGPSTLTGRVDALQLNRWFLSPLLNNTIYGAASATTAIGSSPYGIAFDGSHIWVGNNGSTSVSKIDITTNSVVATTTVGTGPRGIAFDGSHIWASNGASANVSKIDIATNLVVATTTVGSVPTGIAFDGSHIWVSNESSDNVSKIDIATNLVIATTTVGSTPRGVAFDGSHIWVVNGGSDNVSKIDIATNLVVATTTVGSIPIGIAFDGGHIWVANAGSDNVSKIDIATNSAIATTTVGTSPQNIAFDGGYVWVSNGGTDNVSKIDIATNSVVATMDVGVLPKGIAFDGSHMWVANSGGDTVTKLSIGGGGGAYTSIASLIVGTNQTVTGTANYSMVLSYASSASTGGLCINDTATAQTCPTGVGGTSIMADGAITANAFDLAETYTINGSSEPGDLLIVDQTQNTTVKVSEGVAYDRRVLGVASTRPGFVLGWNEGVQVALAGHVPLKVAMTNGTIQIGDALTSSNVAGYAMKATKPGTIVGYALENANATGTIEIFVNVGYSAGLVLNTDGTATQISDDVVFAPRETASAGNPFVDSFGLTFRGGVWNESSTSVVSRDFSILNDVISSTSSLLTIRNSSGTSIFTMDEAGNATISGDVKMGGRLFPSSKGGGVQDDWYVFVDNTSSTAAYISTNAEGWQSQDTYDFAERFYSPDDLQPGDLVVVKNTGNHHVQSAWNETDMLVGIVSTRPAFIAGRPATSTYPIALSGRVPTKVSAIKGAIKAGDPLAPSTMPGVAVKATKTGPIVGLALEDYSSEVVGLVEVNVNPGWWTASVELSSIPVSAGVELSSTAGVMRRGLAKIDAGVKKVSVTYESINSYPFVQVTPRGLIVGSWGTESYTDVGFDIVMSEMQSFDAYFSWQVEPLQSGDRLYQSDGTFLDLNEMTGQPINAALETSVTTTTITTTTTTEPVLEEPPAVTSTEPVVVEPVVIEPVVVEPVVIEPVVVEPIVIETVTTTTP